MKFTYILLTLFSIINVGCSFKKSSSSQLVEKEIQSVRNEIRPEDWNIEDAYQSGVHKVVKTLKSEKLSMIRSTFKVPTLVAITMPESDGFELYEVRGISDLEKHTFIHPKLFISSSTEKGSILGYKTGEKDERGRELVAISIPVALVNGLLGGIPVTGGSASGQSAAITLPQGFKINHPEDLKSKVGDKKLATLPVCPSAFRLKYQAREYLALSPFENLSVCPINQFFRITFKAPADELNELLEHAAIQDEAVHLSQI